MQRFGWAWLGCAATLGAAAAAEGCNTYEESLVEGGGGSSSSKNKGAGGDGEGGGQASCESPGDCPGADTECGTRTCEDGLCGVQATPAGTPTSAQTPGDCKTQVCDGDGDTDFMAEAGDVEDDTNPCTSDTCADGAPMHEPLPQGTPCTGDNGAKVCNMVGTCVECVGPPDCASGICTEVFTCAPASCGDMMQNGEETDTDCGGTMCPGCDEGEGCNTGADCKSGACAMMQCQPSCTDMVENQDETDVDCGGASCPPCLVGQGCSIAADCTSGVCGGTTCGEYQLKISEFRPRGPGGGGDDFVELYNPLTVPVTLSDDIEVASRSDAAASYSVKWTANGQTIPAHGHILLAGAAYSGGVAADDSLSAGLTDKVSVVLRRGGAILDAACLYCGGNPFDGTYTCEGTPLLYSGCSSVENRSWERLPGGAAGNQTDTGDTTADFALITPPNFQNLSSPPAP